MDTWYAANQGLSFAPIIILAEKVGRKKFKVWPRENKVGREKIRFGRSENFWLKKKK